MSIAQIIDALAESGELLLPAPTHRDPSEAAAIAERERDAPALRDRLAALDAACRLEAPGIAPAFDAEAAQWAATMFCQACQFTVYRDADAETVAKALAPPPLGRHGDPGDRVRAASLHWSIDLVFRYLPDLYRLARGLSEADPLVAQLARWARAWPLSAVGIKTVANGASEASASANDQATDDANDQAGVRDAIDEVLGHPCLAVIYVDRVIAQKDWARLIHPAVRKAVRQSFGGHEPWPHDVRVALEKVETAARAAAESKRLPETSADAASPTPQDEGRDPTENQSHD